MLPPLSLGQCRREYLFPARLWLGEGFKRNTETSAVPNSDMYNLSLSCCLFWFLLILGPCHIFTGMILIDGFYIGLQTSAFLIGQDQVVPPCFSPFSHKVMNTTLVWDGSNILLLLYHHGQWVTPPTSPKSRRCPNPWRGGACIQQSPSNQQQNSRPPA